MYRVEDKYVLSAADLNAMQARMEVILPSDHSADYLGYKISSVYFDDLFDTHLRDTVEGNPFRKKFRIRIYNDSFDTIKLEVKSKRYNRIAKISREITYDEMCKLLAGETIPCPYAPNDPRTEFNLAIQTRGLRPKVIVTYERKAFIYPSGNVRITFDRNIRGSNLIESFGDPMLVHDEPDDFNSVLEVKYDEFLPDFVAQSLENNGMWQTANSKYRLCRELYPY